MVLYSSTLRITVVYSFPPTREELDKVVQLFLRAYTYTYVCVYTLFLSVYTYTYLSTHYSYVYTYKEKSENYVQLWTRKNSNFRVRY